MNASDFYDQLHEAFAVRGQLLRIIGTGTPTPIEARYLKQLDNIIRKTKTAIRWFKTAGV